MTRLTSIVLIAALGAAFLLSPASAAPKRAEVHELRGDNSFTARHTSKTLVRFPGSFPTKDFRIGFDGDGRVYGFHLQKTGQYENEIYRPSLTNITVGRCTKQGCRARKRIGNFTFGSNIESELSGTWELYVIADGAPVTVMMELGGRHGAISAPVTDRVTSRVKTLTPTIHEDNGKTLYSAGSYSPIAGADLSFVGMWFSGDTYVASDYGDCAYHEGDVNQPPEEIAFLPGCPTGDGLNFPDVEENPGPGGWQHTSIRAGCCSGIGAWYATAAMIDDAGAVALFIDL